MQTIHKYMLGLYPTDTTVLRMPVGARIIAVQVQHDRPCVWAVVDADAALETRTLRIVGTGHPLGAWSAYHGTFQLAGGDLVFHVFE